jgi:magnesium chelatase family protein
MLSVLYSGALQGIEAVPVTVEVDITFGLPGFSLVGLPDSAIKEARERVFSALKNAGYIVPSRRVTINLAPADLRKEGSALDLPMALGILAASEQIPSSLLEGVMVLGELALDGGLRPARGILSMVLAARKQGLHSVLLPAANAREAALVPGIRLLPADTSRITDRTRSPPRAPPRSGPPAAQLQPPDSGRQRLLEQVVEAGQAAEAPAPHIWLQILPSS